MPATLSHLGRCPKSLPVTFEMDQKSPEVQGSVCHLESPFALKGKIQSRSQAAAAGPSTKGHALQGPPKDLENSIYGGLVAVVLGYH
eukprot:5443717-Amphidinium_carterae.1